MDRGSVHSKEGMKELAGQLIKTPGRRCGGWHCEKAHRTSCKRRGDGSVSTDGNSCDGSKEVPFNKSQVHPSSGAHEDNKVTD
mmetsp:Transcript_36073/g.49202  ORF Transcript_36073/g.49202 Transcript_36073/m.49202 type:complete len:83 (+) Transcript_36073:2-250(+)